MSLLVYRDSGPGCRESSFFEQPALRRATWEQDQEHPHPLVAVIAAVALLATAGCAVSRNQESVGAPVDDGAIIADVTRKMLATPDVAGTSISVETLSGTVMLSGFAKNKLESTTAEKIARDGKGVKAAKNEITIWP